MFNVMWGRGERNIKTLNKFCKVYINGFDGARELRDKLMNANSTTELINLLQLKIVAIKQAMGLALIAALLQKCIELIHGKLLF